MTPGCTCDFPEPHYNHRYPNACRHCLKLLPTNVQSNDQTVAEFFNHLEQLPDVTPAFLVQCLTREKAGREEFGNEFLRRNNALEATEEMCDGAIYAHLEILEARHSGEDDDLALALEAAHLCAKAHTVFRRLAARRTVHRGQSKRLSSTPQDE